MENNNQSEVKLDIYKIHPGDIYTLDELIDEVAKRKYIHFKGKFTLSLYTHIDKVVKEFSKSDKMFLAENPQVWGMTKHVDILDDFKIPKDKQQEFLYKLQYFVLFEKFEFNKVQKDAFLSAVLTNLKVVEDMKEFSDSFNDVFKHVIHKNFNYKEMDELAFFTAWGVANDEQKNKMKAVVTDKQLRNIKKFPSMFRNQLFPGIDDDLDKNGMWFKQDPINKKKTLKS